MRFDAVKNPKLDAAKQVGTKPKADTRLHRDAAAPRIALEATFQECQGSFGLSESACFSQLSNSFSE